ncbi:MAG: DUF2232 domain-containing protein [Peptococcaceae bacterium]|nr:DUF2232 domain-containing protein [Peptococcaceae bacterium]
MNNAITNKDMGRDIGVYFLALGIPVLATALGAWMLIIDVAAIAPVVWLALRRGKVHAVVTVCVAAIAMYLISRSLVVPVSQGLLLLGVSLLLTYGFEHNWKAGKIMFWGSLSGGGYGLVEFLGLGPHPIAQLQKALTGPIFNAMMQNYQQTGFIQMMQKQGVSESQLRATLLQVLNLTARLYPSQEILKVMTIVALAYLLLRYILYKGMAIKSTIPRFREWALPWYAIWGAIIGLAAYLGGDYLNMAWMATVGLNIVFSYVPVCLVLGVANITYVLGSPKVPVVFKLALIFVALFDLPATVVILAVLGLFDMVLNLRRMPESV